MNRTTSGFLAFSIAALASGPALAFCLMNCEPTEADAQKVFANLVHKKFDPDAKIEEFKVDRFWKLDVEGADHIGYEFYFHAKVNFPKGANLDCKPAQDGSVKQGCSKSDYFSTTIQNKMVTDRQYIEPGKTIEFRDETRFNEQGGKWKGQDGELY